MQSGQLHAHRLPIEEQLPLHERCLHCCLASFPEAVVDEARQQGGLAHMPCSHLRPSVCALVTLQCAYQFIDAVTANTPSPSRTILMCFVIIAPSALAGAMPFDDVTDEVALPNILFDLNCGTCTFTVKFG